MPGPRVNPNVGRKDEVFRATATEPLRKHKSSDLQPDAQKRKIKEKAEAIVEQALSQKGRKKK